MLQVLRALYRQFVNPNATVCGGDTPFGFDQIFLEQPLESRIQRTFFYLEEIVRASLDVLDERVAVQRLALQCSENHHLQRTGKEVTLF